MTDIREPEWRLGEDLHPKDDLISGITFEELIDTLRCNCERITPQDVHRELERILEIRRQDMVYLLARNMDEIIKRAYEGRNTG